MRNFFIVILLLINIFFYSPSQAQENGVTTTNWVGLSNDARLEIIFHITRDSNKQFTGTWDSPMEKVMGLKCKSISIDGDSIHIETAAVKAFYIGKYSAKADSIHGYWLQNGHTLPLSFKKMKRPQTPHPPFNYIADSLEYDNPDKTVHLGATLTKPTGNKKYPVAILITGSGLQDRDENIFEHRPFAVIADYLTTHGIAVLRVDDRTVGKSKGDIKKVTTDGFAEDVITSIQYLKTRNDIDTTAIGLIGHSEGGLIAPIVYTKCPFIKFIILLAGPGVSGATISLQQQKDAISKMNMSTAVVDAYVVLTKNKMDILNRDYGDDSLALKDLKIYYDQWKSQYPDSILAPLGAKNATADLFALQIATTELKPWTRFFYKTDPAVYLEKVKCPVLILNGARDKQVYPEQNIPAIKSALEKAGNKKFTVIIFPDLNHLFQHCKTGEFSEYSIIEESFAPEVLKEMGDWIEKNK